MVEQAGAFTWVLRILSLCSEKHHSISVNCRQVEGWRAEGCICWIKRFDWQQPQIKTQWCLVLPAVHLSPNENVKLQTAKLDNLLLLLTSKAGRCWEHTTWHLFGSHASASRDSPDKLIHCSDNLLVFEVIAEVGHLLARPVERFPQLDITRILPSAPPQKKGYPGQKWGLSEAWLVRDPGSKTFIAHC